REIARVLGLDEAQITFEASGLNHCVWLTHFRYKGKDAYPLLDEWIAKESEAYWRTWQPEYGETQMSPAAVHIYHFFGLLPLGDTSRALWPEAWWYHQDLETKKRWWGPQGGFDSAEGWQRYLNKLARGLEQIRAATNDPGAKVTALFPPHKSGE